MLALHHSDNARDQVTRRAKKCRRGWGMRYICQPARVTTDRAFAQGSCSTNVQYIRE
jgi:hypothetical protein